MTKEVVSEIIKQILLEKHWRYDRQTYKDILSNNKRIVYQILNKEDNTIEKNRPFPMRVIIDKDIDEDAKKVVLLFYPKESDSDDIQFLIEQIDEKLGH